MRRGARILALWYRKWRLGLCCLLSRDLVEKLSDEDEDIEVKSDYGVDTYVLRHVPRDLFGVPSARCFNRSQHSNLREITPGPT